MRNPLRAFWAPLLIALAGSASAQPCTSEWSTTFSRASFEGSTSVGPVFASVEFDDDGPGPHAARRYLGGSFSSTISPDICGVVCWDGHGYSRVGSGLVGPVYSLILFDADGPGPQSARLCALGEFSLAVGEPRVDVAQWDGVSWTPLGPGLPQLGPTFAAGGGILVAFDEDGPGGAPATLYAVRRIKLGYQQYEGRIYRFDGTNWTQVRATDCPTAAAALDSGPTPSLFIATAPVPDADAPHGVAKILRLTSGAWTEFQSQQSAYFGALLPFDDDGPGPIPPALYIGGTFSISGGPVAPRLGRCDGATITEVPAPASTLPITTLAAIDPDGPGPEPTRLFAATYNWTDTRSIIWRRDASWVGYFESSNSPIVLTGRIRTMDAFDEDGAGPHPVFVFADAAKWTGVNWVPPGDIPDAAVSSILSFPNASGPQLYVGGAFTTVGGVPGRHIARWDGSWWRTLGQGLDDDAEALCAYDDGSGPALFVAGKFTMAGGQPTAHIAKWTGSAWLPLGAGIDGDVVALCVYDDGSGPALYAAGTFDTAGGQSAANIARWRAGAWSPLSSGANGRINALCVYNDGDGPRLFAGGLFTSIGGVTARYIAQWDGHAWSPLGSDVISGSWQPSPFVAALCIHDDGSGPALFVGGHFGHAGPATNSIAKWQSHAWSPVGTGVQAAETTHTGPIWYPGTIAAMRPFDDDGPGPSRPGLCVAGFFYTAGTAGVSGGFARWDGAAWSSPHGAYWSIAALAAHDPDGPGPLPPLLVAGGAFATVFSTSPSHFVNVNGLAELAACRPACYANCDGSTAPPVLNVNDFLCFLDRFAAADSYANCDASTVAPVLNVNDFLCFLNRFAAGCSGT